MRLQPGVQRILTNISSEDHILDLGCGNGELARELDCRNHRGTYVGLDFSPELIAVAKESSFGTLSPIFQVVDLTSSNWETKIPKLQFDLIFAFAVLHHLPSDGLRQQMLLQVRTLTKPGGHFIHSEWQFLNSPRLRSRIQNWNSIDLSESDVDPGDYLLDWRHGGYGLRYVHHFSEAELANLAADTGFTVHETFLSDGEGGKLGLYQVWKPIKSVK